MTEVKTNIVQEIRDRTKGLMFCSEADFPVEVYCCDTNEPMINQFLKISGRRNPAVAEEVSLSFLYKNFNTLKGIEDSDEEENSKRYEDLINFLTDHLQNIKVYTLGEGEIDLFITGSVENNQFITLATKSLEVEL